MSVANDYPHKNLPDIARGWRLYRDHYSTPLKLVYVGSAAKETRNSVLENARPHEADVIFLGPVADRAYITELYRRAVAAISASSLEAFPLTLHEAGSLGCPLILSDIAPHRELAEGHAAYFPLHGAEELASEIDDVMGRPRPEPWEWGTTWETHARELTDAIRSLEEVRL